jgi:hypothetical protein
MARKRAGLLQLTLTLGLLDGALLEARRFNRSDFGGFWVTHR